MILTVHCSSSQVLEIESGIINVLDEYGDSVSVKLPQGDLGRQIVEAYSRKEEILVS